VADTGKGEVEIFPQTKNGNLIPEGDALCVRTLRGHVELWMHGDDYVSGPLQEYCGDPVPGGPGWLWHIKTNTDGLERIA